MKKAIVLSALLMVLVMPGLLLAQDTCPSKKMMQKETPELSEEQLAKLEAMKLDHRMSCIKLEADLEILELQLKQEMMKDDPSAKELEAIVSKIGDVREKLQMNRINHVLQVRKIVGPDNWKRMGMQGCGMGECGMMGMKGRGGCCGMGGHRGMGEGCCGMGGRHSMGMGCCGMGEGCRGMGGERMGGARMMTGGCMGGMEGMKGCAGEKEGVKTIERRCVKIPTGD